MGIFVGGVLNEIHGPCLIRFTGQQKSIKKKRFKNESDSVHDFYIRLWNIFMILSGGFRKLSNKSESTTEHS